MRRVFSSLVSACAVASVVSADPVIEATPDPISYYYIEFFQVLAGSSATTPIAVHNAGDAPLVMYALNVHCAQGDTIFSAPDFDSGHAVAPGGTWTFHLAFSAPLPGGPCLGGSLNLSAGIYIWCNDPHTLGISYTARGSSVCPNMLADIQWADLPSGSTQHCGNVQAGLSVTKVFTLVNSGINTITPTSLWLTGQPQFSIVQDNVTGQTIPVGGTATFSVRFAPGGSDPPGTYSTRPWVQIGAIGWTLTPGWIDGVCLAGGTPVASLSARTVDGHEIRDYNYELPYGVMPIGETAALDVTLTNTGTGPLTVGTVSVVGPDASLFAITNDNLSGQTLAVGAQASLRVNFTPTAIIGIDWASGDRLDIPSNDATFVNPALTGGGFQFPDAAPSPLGFGSVGVGTQSTLTLSETNAGAHDEYSFGQAFVLGPDGADFAITSDTLSFRRLNDSESGQVSITYSPSRTGNEEAWLYVPCLPSGTGVRANIVGASAFPDFNPSWYGVHMIRLTGTGTGTPGGSPRISVVPSTGGFGYTAVGASSTITFGVRSVGNAALSVGHAWLDGADAGLFAITSDAASGHTLASGSTAPLTVAFTPLSEGSRNAVLHVPSSDATRPTVDVPLAGCGYTATAGAILVSPASYDLGAVRNKSVVGLHISNVGISALHISEVSLSGSGASSYAITSDGATAHTLQPGDTATVRVAFRATGVGERDCIVRFASDDPFRPVFEVFLSAYSRGNGKLPDLRPRWRTVRVRSGTASGAVQIDNTGRGPAGPSLTRVYWSASRSISNATLIASWTTPAIAASQHARRHKVRYTTSGGYFIAVANADGTVIESDTTNNTDIVAIHRR